jgi:hypothetical protein
MDVTEERESYAPGPAPVSLLEISRVLEETARLLRGHARGETAPRAGSGASSSASTPTRRNGA